MSILCKCPACGNTYNFPAIHAGKHVSCAGCQSLFAIPIPALDLTPVAASLAPLSQDALSLDALPDSASGSHPTARPGKLRPAGRKRSKFKLSDLDNQTLVIGSAGGAGLLLLMLVLAMFFLRSGDSKPAAPVLTALADPATTPPILPAPSPAAVSPVATVPPPVVFAPVVAPTEPARTEGTQTELAPTPPPRTDPAATPTVERPPTTDPAASEPIAVPSGTAKPPATAPSPDVAKPAPGKAADPSKDPSSVSYQPAALPLDPSQSKLKIPDTGTVTPGAGRRVITLDESGQSVVALLHCQIDDSSVVMLPSGALVSVAAPGVSPTERPFEPLSRAALLARLQTGKFQKFKTAESDHFGYLYSCSDEFFQTTRDILESLHDGVLDVLKDWDIPLSEPNVPMVVILFGDRASFDAFRRVPAGVAAYYSIESNYVVLHEDPELSDRAPELALKRGAYTIAHEGVHQLLANIGVQQRLAPWPQWMSEGLPEYFCPVRVTSNMVTKDGNTLPTRRVRWNRAGLVNDLRMYGLLHMPTEGGKVLHNTTRDTQLDADGYAVSWGLVHYLAVKQNKAFRAYLREVAATPVLADLDPEYRAAELKQFAKHWGMNLSSLESNVGRYLQSHEMQLAYRDPVVYQTHYVVVHTALRGRTGKVTVYITTSPDGAKEWKASEEKILDPDTKHSFRTEACATRKEAELIVARMMRPR